MSPRLTPEKIAELRTLSHKVLSPVNNGTNDYFENEQYTSLAREALPAALDDIADLTAANEDLTAQLAPTDVEIEEISKRADNMLAENNRLLAYLADVRSQYSRLKEELAALKAASLAAGTRADGLRQAAEIIENGEYDGEMRSYATYFAEQIRAELPTDCSSSCDSGRLE